MTNIGVNLKDKGIITEEERTPKYVFRGEIWMADLGADNKQRGEQQGYRPVVIVQNERGNKHSPTVIVASVTKSIHNKAKIPTHQDVELTEPSIILFEQIFTISKVRLKKLIGRLDELEIMEANYRLALSLGLASC